MLKPDNNAIAIAVSLDDYGNLPNPEYYPEVGDTITATYADDVKYIDSRTGELCTEDTPGSAPSKIVWSQRCRIHGMCFGKNFRIPWVIVMVVMAMMQFCLWTPHRGTAVVRPFRCSTCSALQRTARRRSGAEQYLSSSLPVKFHLPLMYESKATARSEFAQFRQMFLLIGGILCAIIGLVGLLNFFNAMMTGILSRRREFAVLQAVGMTNRQLKTMLIYEGLFYAMSSVAAAFILSLAVGPLAGKMLGSMFWFFEYQFTVLPVLLTIPVFLLLGWLIPCMMYDNAAKCSVVEQLRDAQ